VKDKSTYEVVNKDARRRFLKGQKKLWNNVLDYQLSMLTGTIANGWIVFFVIWRTGFPEAIAYSIHFLHSQLTCPIFSLSSSNYTVKRQTDI